MKRETDTFDLGAPVAVIRDRLIVIGGILMAIAAAGEFACIPLVALRLSSGKLPFSLFFAVFGALMAAVSIIALRVRVEVFENGFAERGFGATFTLYRECEAKSPVYADNILKGRKQLHHVIIHKTDGSAVELAEWMLKPELTERIGLDELPVKEKRSV